MRIKYDIGNIGGNGWAVSFDIGPLSVILGDLVHAWGLRIAWYTDEWAYTVEVSNRPKLERAEV